MNTAKVEFVKEVPAGGGGGSRKWVNAVALLKTRPGIWARVGKVKSINSMGAITSLLKRYGCEAVGRKGEIYARWPKGKKVGK